MKLLKFWMCLLVILGSISILIPPTYANLPCANGNCEEECDCDDGGGSGGGGFGGGGSGGFGAGGQIETVYIGDDYGDFDYEALLELLNSFDWGALESSGSTAVRGGSLELSSGSGWAMISSLMVKVNWGVPANENVEGLAGKFEVYAKMPSSSLYSPQMLQYSHVLLNNVGRLVINKTHSLKDSLRGQTGTIISTTGVPTMRLDQAVVCYENLPAKVSHRVEFMTDKREILTFEFSDDNGAIGLPIENKVNLDYTLKMVNAAGQPQVNGEFYELHYGNGYFVRYNADTLKVLSAHTKTGRVISAADDSVGLAATYTEEGYIRQVYSQCEGLADVVVTEPGVSYEIRCYAPDQVTGIADGLYTVTGEPYTVWRIENPQASSSSPMPPLIARAAGTETGTPGSAPEDETYYHEKPANLQSSKLQVTKIVGTVSEVSLFQYSHGSDGWQLTEPDNLALKSQSSTESGYNERTIETTVKTPTGEVASKTTRKYYNYEFGQRIISAENVAGKTEYRYYTNKNETGSYGQIEGQKSADGYWEGYQYDQYGRIMRVTSPWKNSHFLSSPSECRAIYYSYAPVDSRDPGGNYDHRPRKVEEKILGITTGLVYFAYYTENGQYVEAQERCPVQNAAYGATGNLRLEHRYYPGGQANSPTAGRLQQVIYPNGTTATYTYEYGTWQPGNDPTQGVFTPGNGQALRMKLTRGTTASPAGVANKTFQIETVYDSRGCTVWNAANVYTGSAYDRLNCIAKTYDNQRRMIRALKSNGELYECTWTCCAKASETFPDGTEYTYTYDAKKRLISKTKVGIGSIPDLTTTYTYDAEGRKTSETIVGGDLSSSATTTYDIADRVTSITDHSGRTTVYSYEADVNGEIAQRKTITEADGSTFILAQRHDRQFHSITGSGAIAQFFDAGINQDGTQWQQIRVGTNDSPRFQKSTKDLLGKIFRNEKAGFSGTIAAEYFHNEKNQLVKSSQTGQADSYYTYDQVGNMADFWLDIDHSGNDLSINSSDRIYRNSQTLGVLATNSLQVFSPLGNYSTLHSKSERLNLAAGASGESRLTDHNGNLVNARTSLNRAQKVRTTTTTSPESTMPKVAIRTNGLLTSSRSHSNLTTTYAYDGLGRLISKTEPRIGTTTYTYHTADGKRNLLATATDPAGNTTSYDYDSRGRLITQTNALGKSARCAYNARSQMTQIWGDTQYPVEFIYDELGQQTGMKTFRSGVNWHAPAWSISNIVGDATTWTYDPASGLVTSKIDAAGNAVTYTYTVDGKLATRTWARKVNGQPLVTTYSYDSATGELKNVNYSDDTPDIAYSYDRTGQMIAVTDAAGTRTFAYDNQFNLTSESIDGIYNKTLNFSHTTTGWKGRLAEMFIGEVNHYTYGYDTYGRLNQVNNITYSRLNDSDLVSQIARPNGVNTNFSYEANRNLISQVTNGGISTFGYTNDAIDRRTSMSRNGSAFTAPDVLSYTYNDRNEVIGGISNVDSAYNYSFSFDPIGNRLNASLSDQTFSYITNVLNQYTTINNDSPTYDNDGNMLTRDGWTQTWNAENRLIRMEKGNAKLEFVYDYTGRRVEKKVYDNNTLTKYLLFIYDGFKLIEELDGLNENALLRSYAWQPGEMGQDVPLMVNDGISTYHYLVDVNKNVTELTDSNGSTVAHYEYSSFGQQTKATGILATENPFRFSSEYYDSETGLVYYNYRYYSPELGRWLNLDPIGVTGGNNLYCYVNNNNVNYWDNLGLASCCGEEYDESIQCCKNGSIKDKFTICINVDQDHAWISSSNLNSGENHTYGSWGSNRITPEGKKADGGTNVDAEENRTPSATRCTTVCDYVPNFTDQYGDPSQGLLYMIAKWAVGIKAAEARINNCASYACDEWNRLVPYIEKIYPTLLGIIDLPSQVEKGINNRNAGIPHPGDYPAPVYHPVIGWM